MDLENEGVGTLIQWSGFAVHHHKIFMNNYHLPNTDRIINQSLMLPLNEYITDHELDYIIKTLIKISENFNE